MKKIVSALLLLSIGPLAMSDEILTQAAFIFNGTNYLSVIKNKDLKRSPVWKEEDESPPLSPRRAIQAAQTAATNLFEGAIVSIDFVSLRPLGREKHWIYQVQFITIPPRGLDGDSNQIRLFVLMNGEVVMPTPKATKRTDGDPVNPERRKPPR